MVTEAYRRKSDTIRERWIVEASNGKRQTGAVHGSLPASGESAQIPLKVLY